jgi:type II secretory pathway component PulF
VEALRGNRWPHSFRELVPAGAESGDLPATFDVLAEWHESRALRWSRIVSVALPLMMVPLTGLMVAAIYGPFIYMLGVLENSV